MVEPIVDGRARRWAEHNQARRVELVDAALRAIRSRGAGVGMDDIAAEAGTSKPVLYRHFTDRAGLHRAIAEQVEARITRRLRRATSAPGTPRQQLAAVVEAYLSLTQADPEVYRFVVRPPALEGPAAREVSGITDRVSEFLGEWLAPRVGETRARTWSVAVVGTVQACADRWLASPDPLPRGELVEQLAELMTDGLGAHLT